MNINISEHVQDNSHDYSWNDEEWIDNRHKDHNCQDFQNELKLKIELISLNHDLLCFIQLTTVQSNIVLGNRVSMFPMSLENRFRTLPEGFLLKKDMYVFVIPLNILKCKFFEAL